MNELQQSVANASGDPIRAWIASVLTALFGGSTYYELIGPILGALSTVPLAVLSCVLVYGQIKKGKLERKQLHMQIAVMQDKERERLERGGFETRDEG